MSDRSTWSGQTAALTAVAAIAVTLPVMLYVPVSMMRRDEFESMVLPLAAAGRDGLPARPRLTINVLRDGTVRVMYVTYEGAALRRLLQAELAAHTGPDGRSQLAVHIRGDAYCPYALVQAVLELCRELGIRRVSFGAAPKVIRPPELPLPPPPVEP